MDAMTSRSLFFNWAMLDGAAVNTFSSTKPQRKTSKGDKSGDLSPKNEDREVIASMDVNILRRVLANVVVRIDKCIKSGSGHAES